MLCSAETALPISFHMKANMREVWPVMGNGHNGGVWLGLGKGPIMGLALLPGDRLLHCGPGPLWRS